MVHNRSSWAFFLPGLNPRGIWLQCSLRTNIVCAILIRQQALYWNIGYVLIHTVCILYTLPSCLEDPIVLCFWLKWVWFFIIFTFSYSNLERSEWIYPQKKKRSIPTNWGVKVHLLYSIFCCSVCKMSAITISEMSTIQGNVFVRKPCIFINKIRFYETQIPYCETYVL